jgi:hypothetical protein
MDPLDSFFFCEEIGVDAGDGRPKSNETLLLAGLSIGVKIYRTIKPFVSSTSIVDCG